MMSHDAVLNVAAEANWSVMKPVHVLSKPSAAGSKRCRDPKRKLHNTTVLL